MQVLLIGSGGREHALAWKLAQSRSVDHIFVAPGNAGTRWPASSGTAEVESVAIASDNIAQLLTFAKEKQIDLTVVGPEAPLAAGIVDQFQAQGLAIFGPSQAAAQLEASKAFSKTFMDAANIPTADFATFTNARSAREFIAKSFPDGNVVIKASGLAAGKGVIVCSSRAEADAAVDLIMTDRAFGAAGDELIVEEKLVGPEISVLAFTDGEHVAPLITARDHKRALDGDQGPNTGGMGAFAPVPEADTAMMAQIEHEVLLPAINEMRQRGTPYVGVLYAGLMLTPSGIRVLEFNCRFGDPETQVVLPMLDADLAEVMVSCVTGRLNEIAVSAKRGYCATVVMAAPGYPGKYPKGIPLGNLDAANNNPAIEIFHAGTKTGDDGQILTSGGRVLAISALGSDLEAALERAYTTIEQITFPDAHYRTDIGRT